jgi:DNA-binding GntR family transcriptional regulator
VYNLKMARLNVRQITSALEHEIATGALAPGARLDEAGLAERFGTSRTPVREALSRLASSGFVVHRANKGAIVAKPSLGELMEMFELMAELEAMCGRLAAQRASDQELELLKTSHDACRALAEDGNTEDYYDANARLHETIYAASHNTYLANETLKLRNRLAPYRRLQLRRRNRPLESFAEHEALVSAICEGRADDANQLLRAHVAKQSGAFNDFVASIPSELLRENSAA